jgi:hypothetical protein
MFDKSSANNLFIRSGYLYILKGGLDKSSPYIRNNKFNNVGLMNQAPTIYK